MLSNPQKTIGIIEISWLAKKEEIVFELIDSNGKKIQILNYDFLLEFPKKLEKHIIQGFYWDQKLITKKWLKFFYDNLRNRRIRYSVPQYILIKKFMDSIKNDSDPPVTPQDGRKTVRLLERIEESLNKNKPINLENDL
jgi:predicted dehydrogenase